MIMVVGFNGEASENQLIAKNLLFMKLKKLPRSRMGCMVDRVINVPLTDEQIVASVQTLPRTLVGQGGVIKMK